MERKDRVRVAATAVAVAAGIVWGVATEPQPRLVAGIDGWAAGIGWKVPGVKDGSVLALIESDMGLRARISCRWRSEGPDWEASGPMRGRTVVVNKEGMKLYRK